MSEKDDVRGDSRKRQDRTAHIESLENRYALTAAPVAAFSLDSLYSSQHRTEADVEMLAAQSLTAQSLSSAHSTTNMHSVFANYGLYGTGQTIAVIDSGIAYDHPAFGNAGFGAGYRVVGGWDFAENDAIPYDDAPAGFHGTHVAGIIGSRDANNPGVAQGVDLVSLRVFDDKGNGSFSWVEQALRWVHEHRNSFANPITTINLSLGTNWNSTNVPNWATLEDEFRTLMNDGIFIAVAAGNSFQSFNAPGLSYPAASQYVVPVGSVNMDGTVSYFSQRQDRAIFAPGANIRSTIPDGAGNNNRRMDDWATASGTSMATPYIAGVSTLVREAMQIAGRTSITQNDIYDVLRRTADRVWDSATNQYYLRINVGRAIDSVMPQADNDSASNATANFGVLRSSTSVNGQIQRVNDTDYFTFTAGSNGVVRVSATTKFEVNAKFGVIGATGQMKNGAYEFNVEAGKQYTITLGTSKGVGNYTLTASLAATASNGGGNSSSGGGSGGGSSSGGGASSGGSQQDQQQKLALSSTTNPTTGASLSWNVAGQATVTIINRMNGQVAYQGAASGTSWNGQLAAGNYTATVSVNGQSASQNITMATRVLGITYDVSSTGQTTVRWNAMNGASFYQIRVINAAGQKVSDFQTTGTQFSMNLGGGAYTIAISPNARGSEMLKADVPPTRLSLNSSFAASAMSLSQQNAGGIAAFSLSANAKASDAHSEMVTTLTQIATNLQSRAADQVQIAEVASGVLERRTAPLLESLTARSAEKELSALDELFRKFEEEA